MNVKRLVDSKYFNYTNDEKKIHVGKNWQRDLWTKRKYC